MKPFVVKTDSWHYQLLAEFCPPHEIRQYDFCAYIRSVMFYAIALGIICLVLLVIAGVAGLMMYKVVFSYGLVALLIILLLAGFGYVVARLTNAAINRLEEEDSAEFVKEAYRSWKGKYCKQIEIVD